MYYNGMLINNYESYKQNISHYINTYGIQHCNITFIVLIHNKIIVKIIQYEQLTH